MRKLAVLFCSLLVLPLVQLVQAGPMGGSGGVGKFEIPQVDLYNHTLLGERVLAEEVVTRNRWGTPMLPDGTGGYSLIAAINPEFIARSLIIPPLTDGPVYNPLATATAPDIEPGELELPQAALSPAAAPYSLTDTANSWAAFVPSAR